MVPGYLVIMAVALLLSCQKQDITSDGSAATGPTTAGAQSVAASGEAASGGATGVETPLCAGLSRAACEAQPRCLPIFGLPAQDPFLFRYAGCYTAYDEAGDMILSHTAIACTREGPATPCFLLMGDTYPDGWEHLQCDDLPEDCEVGAEHPAWGNWKGKCRGLEESACAAQESCQVVVYPSGPEQGTYAGCASRVDFEGNPIPSDDPPYCGWQSPGELWRCWPFETRPPDWWILDECRPECI